MDAFVGEIRLFGWNWAPRGWALCNGALLGIRQNTALFSILGTQYGGDGVSTFALPNLQGRSSVGAGQGPGLQNWDVGQTDGTDGVTLSPVQGPAHAHTLFGRPATLAQTVPTPSATTMFGRLGLGGTPSSIRYAYYEPETPTHETPMAPQILGASGGSQPHENRQPYLVMNYCICMDGYFPSRS